MRGNEFDVGYWLLDDQLVDRDGRRCGRVDDIEFEGGPGQKTRISTILTGPGAFRRRLPQRLRRLAAHLLSDQEVAVPWREVEKIGVVVKLKKPASELDLGSGDDDAAKLIGKLPGT